MQYGIGIVAFAFGVPATIRANTQLAQIATNMAARLRSPVYTQADIVLDSSIDVTRIKEEEGNPPPSLRIARGAVKWATERNIERLWVVAADPHLWRAIRDLQMAVKESGAAIEVKVSEKEIDKYSKKSWFSPESTQPRVRTWFNWIQREWIIKLMPFFIYKRVAS